MAYIVAGSEDALAKLEAADTKKMYVASYVLPRCL
jgi:hypothetical protein